MITLINQVNGHKIKFKDYRALYNYIESRQRTKEIIKPQQLPDEWVFTYHSYRRLVAFYEFISRQRDKDEENSGKNKRFDVLEMSYNRSKNPILIPITSGMDIEIYRKEWCQRYCKYHGFKLVEVQEDDGILRVEKERTDIANIGLTYNVWWKE
jgi:hypothetical protein